MDLHARSVHIPHLALSGEPYSWGVTPIHLQSSAPAFSHLKLSIRRNTTPVCFPSFFSLRNCSQEGAHCDVVRKASQTPSLRSSLGHDRKTHYSRQWRYGPNRAGRMGNSLHCSQSPLQYFLLLCFVQNCKSTSSLGGRLSLLLPSHRYCHIPPSVSFQRCHP